MSQVEFHYDPPNQLAPLLWEIKGRWKNKLGRRMTVVRLSDGRLIIHNAIQLHEDELNWLRSLGFVSFIIAPNIFHCSDLAWMSRQFPQAACYVPAEKYDFFQQQGVNVKITEKDFPKDISEFENLYMHGTKMSESVFIHHPSKTLILCDLAFNMPDVFTGLSRIFMRWNKAFRLGPTRLIRLMFTKNIKQLKASYENLFQYDFDRVVVNHGDVVNQNGKELLKKGYEEIFK